MRNKKGFWYGRGFGKQQPLLNWESANDCNPTLLWHQPWVVMLAELQYRAAAAADNKTAVPKAAAAAAAVLRRLSPLVFATADFLADFAERRADSGGTRGRYYDLAPPLTDAAEDQGPAVNAHNPTFELTQVRFALDTAIQWRERMNALAGDGDGDSDSDSSDSGSSSDSSIWKTILDGLAPPPLATLELHGRNETVYNRHQSCLPSVFAKSATGCAPRNNHMAMLAAYGVLPGERYGISPTVMNATMWAVWELWEWESTWSCK
jgi:hypothetical protein